MKKLKEFKNKYKLHFNRLLSVWLQDVPSDVKLNMVIDSKDCFTDHESIQIGLLMFADLETEEELYVAVCAVLEHEAQHILSTTKKAWDYGIRRGAEKAIEAHAAEKEKKKKRKTVFRTERDYDKYLESLKTDGYKISLKSIIHFSHYIENSLEDGRIERIRSQRKPSFDSRRKWFRGWLWEKNVIKKEEDLTNVRNYLRIVLNQVLSLSTTNLFQKNFLNYATKEIYDRTVSLMPMISNGIKGETCKDCMEEGIKIAEALGYEIIEASKTVDLDDLIKQMIDDIIGNKTSGQARSQSEQSQQGEDGSVFGQTDIVIEVDQETYDKLKEAGSLDKDSSSNIKIKGPEPEENGSQDNDGSGSSSSAGGKRQEKTENSNGSGGNDDSNNNDSNSNGTSSAGEKGENSDSAGTDSSTDGTNEDSNETGKSSGGKKDSSDDESDMSANGKGQDSTDNSGNSNGSNGQQDNGLDSGASGEDDSEDYGSNAISEDKGTANAKAGMGNNEISIDELVKKAISDAAIEARSDVEIASKTFSSKGSGKATTKNEKGKKIKTKGLKPVNQDVSLRVIKKNYDESEAPPREIIAQGNFLKREINKIIKNETRPLMRAQKSGLVDAGMIYKAAMKDIEFFSKKEKTNPFNGCCYIMMDNSGSMGNRAGSKKFHACIATSIIEQAFSHIMPLKITAFNASGNLAVDHFSIKDWNEKTKYASFNFYRHVMSCCGNKDGYSIRYAANEIALRPEAKKILIVLSDGTPTAYLSGEIAEQDTTSAIAEARMNGIDVVGIYFGDDDEDKIAFRKFFNNQNAIITSPENISRELVRVLKRYIFK